MAAVRVRRRRDADLPVLARVLMDQLELYRRSGWTEVLSLRPDWLRETAGDEGPDVVVMALPTADRPSAPR
ncbi:hypothetical protein FHP29_13960 [Nocardioides albidus]|uniref:GNAT family N-acetyltransferase n=1 Tax=Nocardioides albidus TaxID=1517589 RepID=A0A5C4VST2_9ACTN|nr:hypothetical protein [Nocardioides albidus]TNM38369.1 hypothetical protein FHP29_13960 [Nocardioides albidus]